MNDRFAVFILSFDRPLQFEVCLRSVITNLNVGEPYDIYVLSKGSNQHIQQCYEDICNKPNNAGATIFHTEESGSFVDSFESHLEHLRQYEACLYLVDDSIVYSPLHFSLDHILNDLNDPEVFTTSLRLGLNTTQQDPENRSHTIEVPKELKWCWGDKPPVNNLYYPISLDGHIYRPSELYDLTKKIKYSNLREWEGELIAYVHTHTDEVPPLMSCLEYSYCVNLIYNQTLPPFNKTMGPFGKSTEELQKMYNMGYRVDLKKTFENVMVDASHMYLPLYLENICV